MPDFNAGTAFVGVLPNASGFLASMQRQIAPALQKIQAQGVSSGAAIGAVRLSGSAVPRVALTREWRAFERDCHARIAARLDRFLGLLQRDDLHPVAETFDRGRARITVDGPRSRILFVLPLDPIARG